MLLRNFFTLSIIFTFSTHTSDIKVALISMPVSGTFLTMKCINMLLKPLGGWKQPKIGEPHLIGTPDKINLLSKNNYKVVFTIRDPRDRIVSYAHKIKKLRPRLKTSIDQLTMDVITKYGTVNYNYLVKIPFYQKMGDFSEYYKLYYPWFDYPDLLFVYFENLVGPKAGGTKEIQLAEIQKIADFLDVQVSPEYIEYIADNLWGGTESFRDPKIGRWKDVFKPKHKAAFKKTGMDTFLINFGYETDLNW